MKNILSSLLIAAGLVACPVAFTAPPPGALGGHVDVLQVSVDDPDTPTEISIVGTDLLHGAGPLVVTLGEYVDPL